MTITEQKKIKSMEEQIVQMKNRKQQLLQRYQNRDRKARTHRICKRGALLEKIQPETINLTDAQIETLLEKVLLTDFANNRIKEMQSEKSSPAEATAAKVVPAAAEEDDSEV